MRKMLLSGRCPRSITSESQISASTSRYKLLVSDLCLGSRDHELVAHRRRCVQLHFPGGDSSVPVSLLLTIEQQEDIINAEGDVK